MKLPSDNYSEASENSDRWAGPCADSFCYHGCDSPHCRAELRLGRTPSEHNAKLQEMREREEKHMRLRLMHDERARMEERKKATIPQAEEVVASLKRHPGLAAEVAKLLSDGGEEST